MSVWRDRYAPSDVSGLLSTCSEDLNENETARFSFSTISMWEVKNVIFYKFLFKLKGICLVAHPTAVPDFIYIQISLWACVHSHCWISEGWIHFWNLFEVYRGWCAKGGVGIGERSCCLISACNTIAVIHPDFHSASLKRNWKTCHEKP